MRPDVHRSRTGCLTCRTRKVKCDEQRPVCQQCHRGTRTCAWPCHDAPRSPQHRPRRPNDTACIACREKKLKCVGALHDACTRCGQLGLVCRRPAVRPPDKAVMPPPLPQPLPPVQQVPVQLQTSPPMFDANVDVDIAVAAAVSTVTNAVPVPLNTLAPASGELPTGLERDNLIDLYFRSVHSAYSLMAMFAMPATPQNMARADAWADAAIQSTLPRVYEGFGAVQLMVLLLAQYYDLNRGRFTSAWLLGGNCTRMMQLMSLHTFDRTYSHKPEATAQLSPLLTPEALRRVAWSTFYADTITDGGRYGFHTVDGSFYRLQLPCDRDRFLEDAPGVVTEPLYPSTPSGDCATLDVAAYLIRTAAVRRRALHFAFRASHGEDSIDQLTAELAAIEADIAQVTDSLPPRLTFTQKNMDRHQDRLVMFLLLHIFRHNLSIAAGRAALLVYRRSTDASHADRVTAVRRSRIAHALPIAELVAEATKAGIAPDPQFGVHAYVALEIVLFEPRRLDDVDPWPETGPPDMNDVLPHLLTMIREVATRSDFVKQLHIEAVHRLLRCDCIHLLSKEDFDAFYSEYRLVGQETAEYDFRDFRWAKLERLKRGVRPADGNDLTMANDESLLEYNVDNCGNDNSNAAASVPPEGITNTATNTEMPVTPAPQLTQPWWGMVDQSQAVNDGLSVDLSWLMDESGYTEYQTGDPTIFWNQLHYI
ncbi:hypothetical protein SBRCBS47491_001827 [Sporothrix bragantina]|uniref:Zn(2)-C6 fungal-type domain-containing protein n=1 Tax=Sporothrix bragantina TaxID=671064 RepID=A0ABP0B1X9_9PEZI